MKTLFIGGVKSGKSRLAEAYTLARSKAPIYLATAEAIDEQMQEKIARHKSDRGEAFALIEEPLEIVSAIKESGATVLVECMTLWLNNMLYYKREKEAIFLHVEALLALDNDIVFVLNDVGSGIIAPTKESREFVNLSGEIAQKLASGCDEVYHVVAGIARQIK